MEYSSLDLSRVRWVYLRHPAGRIHTINAKETDCIEMLIAQGWVKVQQPAFEDKTVIHREHKSSKAIR